ncbi:MAG: siphovirus Gp157 family protein [Gammaproteobacteria bacterium]
MNLKLYEVVNEYRYACEALYKYSDELDGNAVEDTLTKLKGPLEDKIINVAAYIKNVDAEVEVLKAHEKKLHLRRRHLENHIAALKAYLKDNMQRADLKKVKGVAFDVSLRKSTRVVVEDEHCLPQAYIRKVEFQADKEKIKTAMARGEIISGAYIEEQSNIFIG